MKRRRPPTPAPVPEYLVPDAPIELRQIDNRRIGSMTTQATSGTYIRVIDGRRLGKRFTSTPATIDERCPRHDLKARFARGPIPPQMPATATACCPLCGQPFDEESPNE